MVVFTGILIIMYPEGDTTKLIVGAFISTVSAMVQNYYTQNREKAKAEQERLDKYNYSIVKHESAVVLDPSTDTDDLSGI